MRIDPKLKNKLKKHVTEQLQEERQQTFVLKTPFPATQVELESIYGKYPELRDCQMSNEVEKSLIGGFILQYQSKIIDASLKTKISSVVDSLLL
jgi:F0F1-type ATP synthase delta subunit